MALHDRIFGAMGSSWSDTRPLPEKWWENEDILRLRADIILVLKRDFGNSPLWGFKDPRTCKLLPLWQSIFNELGCNPSFVIIHRHPEEVAASLRRRDGFSREKSILLWLDHVLNAERWTDGYPRAFMTFDSLLSDWRKVSHRISDALGIEWPNAPASIEDKVSDFLSPGLRHHKASEAAACLDDMSPWIDEVHRAISAAESDINTPIDKLLSRVRTKFEAARRLLWPVAEDHAAAQRMGARAAARSRADIPNGIKVELKEKKNFRSSIIIPVYNKLGFTKKCLDHIFRNTPHGIYEIIIVDNASTDGTAQYIASLSRPDIRVISNLENHGFARACNQGAAAASSDYFLFLNNDTEPQAGWLEPLIEVLDGDDNRRQQLAASSSFLTAPSSMQAS